MIWTPGILAMSASVWKPPTGTSGSTRPGSSCGELEQELDAEPSTANARLAVENLRVGDDQVFGHVSCLSVRSIALWGWPRRTLQNAQVESRASEVSRLNRAKTPDGCAEPHGGRVKSGI
jgi:hypothetical protein